MSEPMKTTDEPIKKLLSSWEEAVGRTLKSVVQEAPGYRDYLVFRFTDGSAVLLPEYDDDGRTLWRDDIDMLDGRGLSTLKVRVYFGLDPEEAFLRAQREQAEAKARQEEADERAAYELLRAKYEGR